MPDFACGSLPAATPYRRPPMPAFPVLHQPAAIEVEIKRVILADAVVPPLSTAVIAEYTD